MCTPLDCDCIHSMGITTSKNDVDNDNSVDDVDDPHHVKPDSFSFSGFVAEETSHWLTSHIFSIRILLCVVHIAIAIATFIELAHLPLESVFSASSLGIIVERIPLVTRDRYTFNSAILLVILHVVSVIIIYPYKIDTLTHNQKLRRIAIVRMAGVLISMPMIVLFTSVVCGITDIFAAINLGVIAFLVHLLLIVFEVNAPTSRKGYLSWSWHELIGWSTLRVVVYMATIFSTIWASFILYDAPEEYILTLVILTPIIMAPIPVLPLLKIYFPLHPNYWEIIYIVIDFALKGSISLVFGMGKKKEAAK